MMLIENNLSVLNDLWYGHPFVRCLYLAIGMCVGYLYKESKTRMGSGYELLIASIAIVYFFGRNSIPFGEVCPRVFDILLCIFLLYIIASGNGYLSKALSSKNMLKLGKTSMLLFLFHYPIRVIVGTLFVNKGLTGDGMLLAEVVLILLITSFLTYLYGKFENWLRAHQISTTTVL